jgi:hypothetical protein
MDMHVLKGRVAEAERPIANRGLSYLRKLGQLCAASRISAVEILGLPLIWIGRTM